MIARSVQSHVLGWPIWASVGAHLLGAGAAASIGTLGPGPVSTSVPVPIEIVRIEPPVPPAPDPAPPRFKAPVARATTIRRVVTAPETAAAPPAAPAPALIPDEPRREPAPAPAPSVDTPRPVLPRETSPGGLLPGIPGGTRHEGDALLSTGDLPIGEARSGAGAGGGATVPGGGARGDGPKVASLGESKGTGITALARPLGGYQTRPRYPDAARREGVEGEVLLRFEVLATGHVGAVAVSRSTGRDDLDRAAVDAVKTWLFEPARRGKEAVTVWVTLPVRFRLGSGVNE
jgi:protein TonB